MTNSPLGMNPIPVYSWHWAELPPLVRFRIDCVVVVECFRWSSGMLMQSVVIKECVWVGSGSV